MIARAAAVLALVALTGCSEEKAMRVPPPPTSFEQPAEDPLGTAAAVARDRMIGRVLRQVGPASGKSLSETTYLAPAQLDGAQVRDYYAEQAKATGLSALPIARDGLGAGGDAFGFGRPGQGFAVIVQPPLAAAAKRPVTVILFERAGG
ncbi:hypothetical protein U1872_03750 [Sphingomonas sp. RB3P16]|uniref:hypothetical protein n=1 Tax=Parasphingomonas frigoris TaxID=3096163 RepID=UPI002FC751FE